MILLNGGLSKIIVAVVAGVAVAKQQLVACVAQTTHNIYLYNAKQHSHIHTFIITLIHSILLVFVVVVVVVAIIIIAVVLVVE